MPDLTSHIWFRSNISKEGLDHIVQKWPRPDLDGLVRFWPNASGPEASQCAKIIRPCFWENATSPLPVSHFQTRLHSSTNSLDHIVQSQAGSDLVLADCVRCWPNRSNPEANRYASIIWPTFGQCFWANLDRMWIRSGMFTGKPHKTSFSTGPLFMALLNSQPHSWAKPVKNSFYFRTVFHYL